MELDSKSEVKADSEVKPLEKVSHSLETSRYVLGGAYILALHINIIVNSILFLVPQTHQSTSSLLDVSNSLWNNWLRSLSLKMLMWA